MVRPGSWEPTYRISHPASKRARSGRSLPGLEGSSLAGTFPGKGSETQHLKSLGQVGRRTLFQFESADDSADSGTRGLYRNRLKIKRSLKVTKLHQTGLQCDRPPHICTTVESILRPEPNSPLRAFGLEIREPAYVPDGHPKAVSAVEKCGLDDP